MRVPLLAICIGLVSSSAFGQFTTLEDFSVISDAANGREGRAEFEGQTVLVDGSITSFPPDQTTYDRTLVTITRFGSSFRVSPKLSLNIIADGRYSIQKKFEEEEPRRLDDREWSEAKPTVDLNFTTERGIEVFAGMQYWYIGEHERVTESVDFKTVWKYRDAKMNLPHIGFWKQAAFASGGFFYQLPASYDRTVTKTSSDDSVVKAKDTVFSPEQIGLLLRLQLFGAHTDAEFIAIQASSGGPKTEEEGESIYDDHFRLRIASIVPIDSQTLNLYFSLIHKTLSYANSSYMSLETLPMTTAHVKFINGSVDQHYFVGLVYGYASDTQSLPEFNQKFKTQAYGGKLGFKYSF